MKQALLGLIGAIVLLAIAFLPPVVAAAEQNENVHFGEHVLILLAGLLLAYPGQFLIRTYLTRELGHAAWGRGIAVLGLLLFLASQVPAVDAIADAVMAIHMLQHLVILVSGGLMGTGLLTLASSARPTTAARSR